VKRSAAKSRSEKASRDGALQLPAFGILRLNAWSNHLAPNTKSVQLITCYRLMRNVNKFHRKFSPHLNICHQTLSTINALINPINPLGEKTACGVTFLPFRRVASCLIFLSDRKEPSASIKCDTGDITNRLLPLAEAQKKTFPYLVGLKKNN
jgi:hypothetical protein